MIKEEILESNKLIAEFMGANPCKDWQGYNGYNHEDWYHTQWSSRYQDNLELYSYKYSDLKYHFSWEWLMPVVEKIDNMENSYIETNTNIGKTWIDDGNDFSIYFSDDRIQSSFRTISGNAKKKIDAVWCGVVEFIKWYNKQKEIKSEV